MAVNVRGVFLGLREVIPAMRRRGGGAIVNVSSQAGVRGVTNLCGYSASKHAVVGLSRGAALEEAPTSASTASRRPDRHADDGRTSRRRSARQGGDPLRLRRPDPAGRYGQPDEIAAFVVWLLAEAPPFLTGAVLSIDGGMTTP